MANFSNNSYDVITDNRSIPFNSALPTGTIGTEGIAVTGVGTKFLSEMPTGSVIVDLSAWEWRKVVRVDSDTLAYIEKAFSSDIAPSTTPQIIPSSIARAKMISISTAGAALIDNKAFTGALSLPKSNNEISGRRDFVDPIIVDATSTSMQVSILY